MYEDTSCSVGGHREGRLNDEETAFYCPDCESYFLVKGEIVDANTGYIITEQNAQMLANISGKKLATILANKGWAVAFTEEPYPEWSLMPKTVFDRNPKLSYVDSPLNGLPTRSEAEIRKEWADVNVDYRQKLDGLKKELARAKMRDEGTQRGDTVRA